jgi:hypothetical protein
VNTETQARCRHDFAATAEDGIICSDCGASPESVLHEKALNEARWAACNTSWDEGCVPSMEKAGEVADNVIAAYLRVVEGEGHGE